MVVFGHSLSQNDKHLVRAMRGWQSPIIAVSVLPGQPEGIVALKATIQECLPDAQLRFFDATTHPLGDPVLRIDPNYRPPILRPVTNPHAGAG